MPKPKPGVNPPPKPQKVSISRNKETNSTALDALLEHLTLTVEGLVEETAIQAALFRKAAEYRVDKMRARSQIEMEFKLANAEQALRYRQRYKANGDKLTEDNLKELLLCEDRLVPLRIKLNEAEAGEEDAKLLLEAFRQRSFAQGVISSLTGAERAMGKIVDSGTKKLKDLQERLQEKYPEGDDDDV